MPSLATSTAGSRLQVGAEGHGVGVVVLTVAVAGRAGDVARAGVGDGDRQGVVDVSLRDLLRGG